MREEKQKKEEASKEASEAERSRRKLNQMSQSFLEQRLEEQVDTLLQTRVKRRKVAEDQYQPSCTGLYRWYIIGAAYVELLRNGETKLKK